MKNISNFSIFLCLLVLAIILQIILGTLVRITDSGLSCPDWPLCYGLWFPSREKIDLIEGVNFSYFQILLEWIHRLNTALIIVPLTFILFIKSIFQISLKYFKKLPTYKVLSHKGPQHNPSYKVSVKIHNSKFFYGTGNSKKIAKHNAAGKIIKDLKIK